MDIRPSKLQDTTLSLSGENGTSKGDIKILADHNRDKIMVNGRDDKFVLSVEDAYHLGMSLMEHALECGMDPHTGGVDEEAKWENCQWNVKLERKERKNLAGN